MWRIAILALVLSVAAGAANKAQAETGDTPILQLDPGGHMAVIKGLAFTPDGNYIVSAGDDKVVRVWDWRAGKTVRTIRGLTGPGVVGKIYSMALSPDGRWLAVAGWTHPQCAGRCGDIRLYDFASGELRALLKGHVDTVLGLAFSPDCRKLISGSYNGEAIIWDLQTRTVLHRLKPHRDQIYNVGFTPDGARAVTGSYDKTLRLWSVDDGALLAEMPGHNAQIRSLSIARNGVIASGDLGGEIRLWDGRNGAALKLLANQKAEAGALSFSPDGNSLLSASGFCVTCSRVEYILDVRTGRQTAIYNQHDNSVFESAYSPDGRLVATGGFNGDVQVWDPSTGERKAILKSSGKPTWSVAFSTDGRAIAWGKTNANPTGVTPINLRGQLETSLHLPLAGEILSPPEPAKTTKGWLRANAVSHALSLRSQWRRLRLRRLPRYLQR